MDNKEKINTEIFMIITVLLFTFIVLHIHGNITCNACIQCKSFQNKTQWKTYLTKSELIIDTQPMSLWFIELSWFSKTKHKNQIKNVKMLSGQRAVTPNFENNLFLFPTHLLCFLFSITVRRAKNEMKKMSVIYS